MVSMHRSDTGFSLVEVLTVVAIIGIMSAIAVPPMLSWLSNKGLHSASRELYSNMRKAQSNAIKRNRNCAITFSGTTGYTVYVDENASFSHDPGEPVLADVSWSQYRNVELDSVTFPVNGDGDRTIAFRPNLIPVVHGGGGVINGTARLKNSAPREMEVVVNNSGNISLRDS